MTHINPQAVSIAHFIMAKGKDGKTYLGLGTTDEKAKCGLEIEMMTYVDGMYGAIEVDEIIESGSMDILGAGAWGPEED
jgi:hypothetical protein